MFFWIPPGKSTKLSVSQASMWFQSLFFWIPPGKPRAPRSSRTDVGFQSLFFWIPPGKSERPTCALATWMFQSLFFWIPPGKFGRTQKGMRQGLRFQSLFFWIPPGKWSPHVATRCGQKVSILVLLDTSRKAARRTHHVHTSRGFNPCSLDTSRKGDRRLRAFPLRHGFNPCSSGYLPESGRSPGMEALASRFQSLFFWIPPGKRTMGEARMLRLTVSILVLLDTSRKAGHCQWIQPDKTGFNPCSSGYLPESYEIIFLTLTVLGFQSLFFWIPPGKRGGSA